MPTAALCRHPGRCEDLLKISNLILDVSGRQPQNSPGQQDEAALVIELQFCARQLLAACLLGRRCRTNSHLGGASSTQRRKGQGDGG
jgi:hypothetical protein